MPSPGEFAANLREQKLKRRKRRLILGGGSAAVVLIVGMLVWLLVFSSVLDARTVEVEGLKLLDEETVVEQAAVPMGTPLVRVRTGGVAERVATLSEVRNAFVTREFPNTIRIKVVEREPLFQIAQEGGFSYVDGEAQVVRTAQPRAKTMPEAKISRPSIRKLVDVGAVVGALPDSIKHKVEVVQLRTVDRIELQLQDDRTVVWGSADESELKAQVLEPLLGVEATVYDVSAPNHPTTR